jgi:mRNA guanylyltransferase
MKRYLVFDCLVLDRECLTNRPFDKRIGRFNEFVSKPLRALYKAFPEDVKVFPFEVRFKDMDKPYALEAMFHEKLPNLPHGNDGLVFTCKGSNYMTGTDKNILKWKPAEENTIDFKLRLGDFPWALLDDGTEGPNYDAKPPFDLLIWLGGSNHAPCTALTVTDQEWEILKSLGEQLDGRIIECFRSKEGQWRYKTESNGPRFRDDKEHANHKSTMDSVIESIKDGVSKEDLIAAAPAIQRAWKQRHPEEEAQKRAMAQRGPPPMNGQMNGR